MTNISLKNNDKSPQIVSEGRHSALEARLEAGHEPGRMPAELSRAVPLIGPRYPWLAPLAGHTDLVLRVLCREYGAAVACTEMVSAKGLIYGERGRKGCSATAELLRTLRLPEGALVTVSRDNDVFAPDEPYVPDAPDALAATGGTSSRTRAMLTEAAGSFPAGPDADSPLVVQLFGDEPEFLGQAVELLRVWGFDWFDLNLGCSVPKVNKAGAGSALARDMAKTLEAAKAMIRAAGPMPAAAETGVRPDATGGLAVRGRVGFKIRLGWSAVEENYLELAQGLEQCGAAWITLHPRHARQGFSGEADWQALEKLRQAVCIPVMASGDLFDAASAVRCLGETGVDGVMFARGALRNPAVFADFLQLLEKRQGSGENLLGAGVNEFSGQERRSSDPEFLHTMILRHAALARAVTTPDSGRRAARLRKRERPEPELLKLRGSIPRYVKDLPGSRAFRVAMSHCSSWPMFHELVEEFFAACAGGTAESTGENRTAAGMVDIPAEREL